MWRLQSTVVTTALSSFPPTFLVWCCQLGNRQLTSSPLPNFEVLSRHHCGLDRTVCVQVVLEVRPAPVYPALRSAAGRCRRQLDPRKFRIALAVARVVAIIASSLSSKSFTCSPLVPRNQKLSKDFQNLLLPNDWVCISKSLSWSCPDFQKKLLNLLKQHTVV